MTQITQIGSPNSLAKDKKDRRDFSYSKTFGSVSLEELPEEFEVAKPLVIKDQFQSDMCVAAAFASVAEDHENVPLSMEWFFMKLKEEQGDWTKYGASLKDGAKLACVEGFLEEKDSQMSIGQYSRDEIANWNNWKNHLDLTIMAGKHRQLSYYKVDGNGDTFDNFRRTLYMNRADKMSIATGVLWCPEWTIAENGVINLEGTPTYAHAFKVYGWCKRNDITYLKAQLSNGTGTGDNGIFYFSREVANKTFVYGGRTIRDLSPEDAKKKAWSWWQVLLDFIKKLIYG